MIEGLSRELSVHCATRNHETLKRNYFANLPIVRAVPGVKRLIGLLSGRMAYVVGAGPSLDEALPELRTKQGAIIACDRAARPLLQAGIRPDWIVACEIDGKGAKKLEGIYGELRNIPLAFDPLCNPDIVHKYPGPLYTWNKPDEITNKGKVRLGTGVVTYAVGLAELMEAEQIVLVGVDLGYPAGKMHASGCVEISGEIIEGRLDVEAVDGSRLESDAYMACNIEELAQAAREGAPLVQTSPIGAKIPGALHVRLEDL